MPGGILGRANREYPDFLQWSTRSSRNLPTITSSPFHTAVLGSPDTGLPIT